MPWKVIDAPEGPDLLRRHAPVGLGDLRREPDQSDREGDLGLRTVPRNARTGQSPPFAVAEAVQQVPAARADESADRPADGEPQRAAEQRTEKCHRLSPEGPVRGVPLGYRLGRSGPARIEFAALVETCR